MATIVDVAALAGVSTSTVSHVLNDTRRVKPATRRRVLEAIEKTAYRQDAVARAMRRSRTDSIGLVISDAGEPVFAEMVHGVEHAAAKLGLTLLLSNSAESAEQEARAVRVLLERRVDGLILARAAGSSADVVKMLEGESTAVVLLDRTSTDSTFDQVGAENRDPMGEMVSHLIGVGHRRFVVIAGDTRVSTLRERTEGFIAAINYHGLNPGDQTVLVGEDRQILRAAVEKCLLGALGATAYIACSTVLAVETLMALRATGKEPPRDVAFATFDGFSHAELFSPSITTVVSPGFAVGVEAVGLLQDRLKGSTVAPRTVRLRQSIEYRGSTELFTFGR